MTVFSAALIFLEGDSEKRRRDIFLYLVTMQAGAALVISAFMLFAPFAPSLDFPSIRSAAGSLSAPLRAAIFLLAFFGFGTKAGLIPLHVWLPRAHPIAPTPVSALMSGIMLKTAVYAFLRFVFDFLAGGPPWGGYVVLVAGTISAILGILYALFEIDLKRLLAYSSIENIGIIYLAIGASMIFLKNELPGFASLALLAALLHSLNHAVFKNMLFLGAGVIQSATNTLKLNDLGGLLRRMPVIGILFLVGCASIAGLPLFNGFVGEWIAFQSFLAGRFLPSPVAQIILPLTAGALALTGALAATCFINVYGVAFLGRPRNINTQALSEESRSMLLPVAALVPGGDFAAVSKTGYGIQSVALVILPELASRACPTNALTLVQREERELLRLDYGECIGCGRCMDQPGFTPAQHLTCCGGSKSRLVRHFDIERRTEIDVDVAATGMAQREIFRLMGRALNIRQLDAGSCNGCEAEIGALTNPYYDLERFGIHFVASPKHADMLLVTGPVTRNMAVAVQKTYEAVPAPKLVVAVGACGCSGGIFSSSHAVVGPVDKVIPVDGYIPGCPPTPGMILTGILEVLRNASTLSNPLANRRPLGRRHGDSGESTSQAVGNSDPELTHDPVLHRTPHKNNPTLRIAIQYLPESEARGPFRHLLIVYGQTGKALLELPYMSVEELLAALRAAGISLPKEEEEFVLRNKDQQEHYVLAAGEVALTDSQLFTLGLNPPNHVSTDP
jgi:Ni,Fe-hydrogenase III small subunit/NADH:ubiquinone oxidoreductase subunit 2 (subunit N)